MARRAPPPDDVSWLERFAGVLLGALGGVITFVSFAFERGHWPGMRTLEWCVGIGAVIGAFAGAGIAQWLLGNAADDLNWTFTIFVLPALIAVAILVIISMT